MIDADRVPDMAKPATPDGWIGDARLSADERELLDRRARFDEVAQARKVRIPLNPDLDTDFLLRLKSWLDLRRRRRRAFQNVEHLGLPASLCA